MKDGISAPSEELECCFVNRFLRDFKKFSKLFLFSGF